MIQTTRSHPASAASNIASPAKLGGTNTNEVFAPVAEIASFTELKIGIPSISSPPFPGLVPATTLVP